jgi:hypothetical protein
MNMCRGSRGPFGKTDALAVFHKQKPSTFLNLPTFKNMLFDTSRRSLILLMNLGEQYTTLQQVVFKEFT